MDIVKATCEPCGYSSEDTTGLVLWNNYGDCPRCGAEQSTWVMSDGMTIETEG
jgi:Zn finger protein HypA/HybF involved in hydrogenase expression